MLSFRGGSGDLGHGAISTGQALECWAPSAAASLWLWTLSLIKWNLTLYLIVSGLFHWACSQGTSLCGICICQVGFLTCPLMDTRSHAFVAIMLIWMWVGMKIYNFWNALISIFLKKLSILFYLFWDWRDDSVIKQHLAALPKDPSSILSTYMIAPDCL